MTQLTAAEKEWDRMNTEIEKRDGRIEHLTNRCAELDADVQRLSEQKEDLRTERDQWRADRLPDREAEMISGCVHAIDRYFKKMSEDSTDSYGNVSVQAGMARFSVPYPVGWQQPEALGDPVGRVLLALAARYGLAIEAVPATPPARDDGRELAEAINRTLVEFGSRPR